MVYDDALFRASLPEFSNTTTFPPALISAFWDVASDFIDANDSPCRILNGSSLALAVNYLAAHLMTLSRRQSSSATGPGSEQGGFETSASIGEISVSTLAPPARDGWEWWLASTPYGQNLWALLQLKAVGGISIGGLPEREGFRKVGGVFW